MQTAISNQQPTLYFSSTRKTCKVHFVFGISNLLVLWEAFRRIISECPRNIFLAVTVLFSELIKVKFLLNRFQPTVAFHIKASYLFYRVKKNDCFYLERNTVLELVNLMPKKPSPHTFLTWMCYRNRHVSSTFRDIYAELAD